MTTKTISTNEITEEMFNAFHSRKNEGLSSQIFALLEAAPSAHRYLVTCQLYKHQVKPHEGCGECNLPMEFIHAGALIAKVEGLRPTLSDSEYSSGRAYAFDDVIRLIKEFSQ